MMNRVTALVTLINDCTDAEKQLILEQVQWPAPSLSLGDTAQLSQTLAAMLASKQQQPPPLAIDIDDNVCPPSYRRQTPSPNPPPCRRDTLFVTNLPHEPDWQILREALVTMIGPEIRPASTYVKDGHAFIRFHSQHEAASAMQNLTDQPLWGTHLRVEYARPRKTSRVHRSPARHVRDPLDFDYGDDPYADSSSSP